MWMHPSPPNTQSKKDTTYSPKIYSSHRVKMADLTLTIEKNLYSFINFWRWIMQQKVCRFMGFASAVNGLLCYALGSSLNHLFGNWTLWKILLHTVFSFTVCLVILFAKSLQHSQSFWFKAHTTFFVLDITSLHSFSLIKW